MGWSQDSVFDLLSEGSQWDSWPCGCWFGSSVFRGCSTGHPEKNGPHWPWGWDHWCWGHEFLGSYYGWLPGKDHIPKLGTQICILLCAHPFPPNPHFFQTSCLVGLESKQSISTSGNCGRGATSNLGRHWRPGGCQTGASGAGSGRLIYSRVVVGHCLSV